MQVSESLIEGKDIENNVDNIPQVGFKNLYQNVTDVECLGVINAMNVDYGVGIGKQQEDLVTPIVDGDAPLEECTLVEQMESEKVGFTDPVILEKLASSIPAGVGIHFDPMTSVEVVAGLSTPQNQKALGSL